MSGHRAHVITVSDGVSAGTREDLSGPALVTLLQNADFEVSGPEVVPDTHDRISDAIVGAVVNGADFVVTTGGTGLGPRDVTPEATAAICDKLIPGLAEEMRRKGLESTPRAVLSRCIAGVRGATLIVNLPGSPKGAAESLAAIAALLPHASQIVHGARHE